MSTVDSTIEQLVARLQENEDEFWRSVPASQASIAVVEQRLGVTLPPSYKRFLTEYGAMAVCDDCITGIIDDEPDTEVGGNILSDTSVFREEESFPSGFVVICKHEDGAYCLDFSRVTPSGEVPVVNFEFGSIQHEVPVSKNFREWFLDFFLRSWIEEDA